MNSRDKAESINAKAGKTIILARDEEVEIVEIC